MDNTIQMQGQNAMQNQTLVRLYTSVRVVENNMMAVNWFSSRDVSKIFEFELTPETTSLF